LLIAAGNIEDAIHSFKMCNQYNNCYATIGVHPCRAKEPFDIQKAKSVDDYFERLEK
jgi:Tat protein secretion system quality control protein TatD with DNase activity